MPEAYLFSPEDTARLLGVSRAHVYRLLTAGQLVGVKVGRSRRITRESVESYIADLVAASAPEPVAVPAGGRDDRSA